MKLQIKKSIPETASPPKNAEYQEAITTDKNGQPLGMKKRSPPKEPKPKGAFKRGMNGEHLCITVRRLNNRTFETTESWIQLNEAVILDLGYRPVKNYPGQSTYGTKYIKFVGFEKYPIMRQAFDKDGNPIEGELEEIKSMETASSLADYLYSDSQQRAIDSMRVSKVSSGTNKMILVYIAVVFVGLIGGYLYLTGRS